MFPVRIATSPLVLSYTIWIGKGYPKLRRSIDNFCRNTYDDPLCLRSFREAQDSLAVPLFFFHDSVIGTFDVESPEPQLFHESDLQFLELFTRDVAMTLHTLEWVVV